MTLGGRRVLLYPIYHPAAALYTPAMLKVLESDFARIPALLEARPRLRPRRRRPRSSREPAPPVAADVEPVGQLGLF